MITVSKFKTLIIHTSLNGSVDSLIYELIEPVTFADAQCICNKSNTVYAIVTTEGIVGISPHAVVGFELQDPVGQ